MISSDELSKTNVCLHKFLTNTTSNVIMLRFVMYLNVVSLYLLNTIALNAHCLGVSKPTSLYDFGDFFGCWVFRVELAAHIHYIHTPQWTETEKTLANTPYT